MFAMMMMMMMVRDSQVCNCDDDDAHICIDGDAEEKYGDDVLGDVTASCFGC